MKHAWIQATNADGRIMLEYLDSISMMLLCLQAAYLTFHCHKWKAERSQFTDWTQSAAHSLQEDLQEFGALLSDIADILDSSPNAVNTPPSAGLQETITNALLQSVMGGLSSGQSGKTQIEREIPEEIESNPQETENESNISGS